ncbi:S-adenosyl-L-methionine-dependent methyltransferase [Aspergillus welwitschiae]|uniref:Sterol 24-C-methyltransferase n=1 Tax=Aspergillus welwitschiae TaxID=1341132 RepID=A0A3F3PTN7_9EURO|nr:S-adenosyl-L-methionine-dependent methyltransferase [Aspergillus welwitschiae]RDH30289.1 S-adenosyl-L-methionine-dependent methyltransferase [Aspergillus welwitschiae]GLA18817.1 delta(24)-sterol C-methyltransferase [Aspergillus niger]
MELEAHHQDKKDAILTKRLHGNSGKTQGLLAMRKDFKTHKVVLDGYFKYFGKSVLEEDRQGQEKRRQTEYATMVKLFYHLATDFYEFGWCKSLHFCRFSHEEDFLQAIARHEHYLAYRIGIKEGMSVLDAGCGLGGPAREIAKFTNAHITGLNNSDYQIEKARRYTSQAGLEDKVSYRKGSFVEMDFPDGTFDAVYAIEATLHAPTLEQVYSEVYRVLKPGAVFGVYEWLLTEKYDEGNTDHRQLALGIQQGNGIAKLFTVSQGLAAMKSAGFEILHHEDLAHRPCTAPWYYPLDITLWNARRYGDLASYALMSKWGRIATHYFTMGLEAVRIVPKGTTEVGNSLDLAGDSLVDAGKLDIFTPMYLMLGRKPDV